MPFKILTLKTDVDDTLQTLQKDNAAVNAVTPLGRDADYNSYLLVDYDPSQGSCPAPLSGSVPVIETDDDTAPANTDK